MKFISTVIFFIYVTTAKCYNFNLVKGINYYIDFIQFDSESNIYVANSDQHSKLFKLDSQKNILWTVDLVNRVENILVNKRNDVYLIEPIIKGTVIHFIQANTSNVEQLPVLDYNSYIAFMDDEGNFIHGDVKYGIQLLRPGENIPVGIKNLENFHVNANVVDTEGNIYLAGFNVTDSNKSKLVTITNEEKHQEKPKAYEVENVVENDEEIQDLLVDVNNNLLIFIRSPDSNKILNYNKNVTTLLTTANYKEFKGRVLKNRVFIALMNMENNLCAISYFTTNLTFTPITSLQNLESNKCKNLIYESDCKGNVFIGSSGKMNQSSVEYVANDESKSIGVDFGMEIYADLMSFDNIGTLWVSTLLNGLFTIKKDSLQGEHVELEENLSIFTLRRNPYTNELFIGTSSGLYFVTN